MEVDGAKEEEGNNLLQLFWGLSSLEEEERLVAGRQLLLTLTPLQVGGLAIFGWTELTAA